MVAIAYSAENALQLIQRLNSMKKIDKFKGNKGSYAAEILRLLIDREGPSNQSGAVRKPPLEAIFK